MSSVLIHRHLKLLRSTTTQTAILIQQQRTFKKGRNPEDPHEYYKWGYKPLPTQTSLDEQVPEFAIRSPEFRLPQINKGRLTRKQWRKKIAEIQQAQQNTDLEKLARTRKLFVSLEEVESEWRKDYGLIETQKLAKFYGLNRDLFNNKDIVLETLLDVAFNDVKVHRGNYLDVQQALNAPTSIDFKVDSDSYYSIVLANIDGNPVSSHKEVVHWMVCNMKGNDVSSGDLIHPYIPPLPWKGTGYHRLVFTLYKHSSKVSTTEHSTDSSLLSSRFFSTPDFLSTNTELQPVGLAWFQSQWDEDVSKLCTKFTDVSSEPVFDWNEYIEPKDENKLLLREMKEMKYRNM